MKGPPVCLLVPRSMRIKQKLAKQYPSSIEYSAELPPAWSRRRWRYDHLDFGCRKNWTVRFLWSHRLDARRGLGDRFNTIGTTAIAPAPLFKFRKLVHHLRNG